MHYHDEPDLPAASHFAPPVWRWTWRTALVLFCGILGAKLAKLHGPGIWDMVKEALR